MIRRILVCCPFASWLSRWVSDRLRLWRRPWSWRIIRRWLSGWGIRGIRLLGWRCCGCWIVLKLWLGSRHWNEHLLDWSHLLGNLGLAELLSAAKLCLLACLSL